MASTGSPPTNDRGNPVTTISLSADNPARIKADAVAIGVVATSRGIRLAEGSAPIAAAYSGDLKHVLTALGATGKAGEVHKVPKSGRLAAALIIAVGMGSDPARAEGRRRAAGSAARAAVGSASLVLALPTTDLTELADAAQGAMLGAYEYLAYRSKPTARQKPVRAITLAGPAATGRDAQACLSEVKAVARAIGLVRDLVNQPPRDLTPDVFAGRAATEAEKVGVSVDVLDDEALRAGGYGGLVGVGQGSAHPPRLVRLGYTHPEATRTLALVGKGITFDSGGLSLKPAAAMDWMKADMGGSAAVLGAVTAIARLKLPVNVTGWMALAENMPSGTAQRPGDVITIRGGKTVEVTNTDAEGRLVLADALVRAGEEKPDVIIDAATLTGAQMVALGARTGGVMGNNDAIRPAVHQAAVRGGDTTWPMPLPDEMKSMLESHVADLSNLAMNDRYGGMLAAGLFLQEFVPAGTPWVHLDIAGPAFNEGAAYGYTPRGGTGAGVRTFVAVAQDLAAGRLTLR
jgi:leucyl aminopeptidase